MAITIVDNESKYTASLLKLLAHEKPRVVHYSELDYKKIAKGDTVILTGGHGDPVLWHKKQYAREAALIKHHKGPVIGICLGHELIAHIYGSHLHFLDGRRKGEVYLRAARKSSVYIPKMVRVYENHNWSVRTLKRPLKALVFSTDGVEILKHSRKPIYGLQFHPEESSAAAKQLFFDILEKVRK